MLVRISYLLLLVVSSVEGYRYFQDKLPNGEHVPHPCKPNFIWRGLGHLHPYGGGPRNKFGLDFIKHGKWTKELCNMDSDGDGRSNGLELGDPSCIWEPGTFPSRTMGITHPGICDPWGSPGCKSSNEWVTCETGEFKCDAIHEPDVMNLTIRFPPTKVPAEETSYYCMTVDLDLETGKNYHLIANTPFIDNENVMHHIVLFGCDNAPLMTTPALCGMSQDGCTQAIGVWTLGLPGECLYKEAGFKLGEHGMKRVGLQFHWTNPQKKTDYVDSSGLTLYFTPKLRPYNAGVMFIGQTYLEVPPGQQRVTHTSTCTERCSHKIFKGPVQATVVLNHMHYLGFQENVEQFRDGRKIRDFANDETYSYDNPTPHIFENPVEIRPGDKLHTTCTYRSVSRKTTAYYGDGTYDEMCFSIFTYYPLENYTGRSCITWKDVDMCDISDSPKDGTSCNMKTFFNKAHPETEKLREMVLANCNFYGSCRVECPAAIAEAKNNPCLQGQIGEYVMQTLSQGNDMASFKFVLALKSCDMPQTSGGNAHYMRSLSLVLISIVGGIFL